MSLKKSKWHCPLKLTKLSVTLEQENLVEYQPKTLHKHNQQRRQFLPTFPNQINQSTDETSLLLANVPAEQLSPMELIRRSSGVYPDPFNSKHNKEVPSYMYHILYENLFGHLKKRLQIDTSILDYNLHRLYHIIDLFQSKYRSYEGSDVLYDHHFQLPANEKYLRRLEEHELIILLEFFLQIDVDLFFMKTCLFRMNGIVPNNTQLFSTDKIANSLSYDMKPCQKLFCTLCQSNEDSSSRMMNTVEFSTSGQKHRFLNGYETMLNCPANCQTNGIIYALTCVCGEYDYIGSTKYTLNDILEYHRQNANRLMIEYLINGEPFLIPCICNKTESDKQYANKMRLYQHFAHCSKALEIFLRYNHNYWCFIPMKIADVQFDDVYYSSVFSLDNEMKETHYLTRIPKPPLGYLFSKRQQVEQRQFFEKFNPYQYYFHSTLDFYRATIIAVLPHSCSTMLRHMIEILFVTHAETKLNSINLLTGDTNLLYHLPYKENRIWCEHLLNPSLVQ